MMNCEKCRGMMLDLLYEELESDKVREAQDHLAACPECAREYKQLTQTLEAVATLPDPEAPPYLNTRIMAHAKEAAEKAARPRSIWSWVMSPATATAAVMVIAASIVIIMGKGGLETGTAPLSEMQYDKNAAQKTEIARAPDMKDAEAEYEHEEEGLPPQPSVSIPAAVETDGLAGFGGESHAGERKGSGAEERERKIIAEKEESASARSEDLYLEVMKKTAGTPRPEEASSAAGPECDIAGALGDEAADGEDKPGKSGLYKIALAEAPKPSPPPASEAYSEPMDRARKAPAKRDASDASAVGGLKAKQAVTAAKPSPAVAAPDAGTLIKQASGLEEDKKYKDALVKYELALSMLGYDKDETREKVGRKKRGLTLGAPAAGSKSDAGIAETQKPACSPRQRTAARGAIRCYKKLLKLSDAKKLEQWLEANCPSTE